jgi:hypothetical protein
MYLFPSAFTARAQTDPTAGTFWHPNPPVYAVKNAIEVEA